jgi:hypothetical protein
MYSFPRKRLAALTVVVAASIACSSTSSSLPDCTGAVTITATAGTTPRFSWTPACQVEGLIVAFPGPGAIVWNVESASQTNTIGPGVRYGVAPAGATVVTAPAALVAGTSYAVTLFRFDDGHGGSIQSAGGLTFVP